MNKYDIIIWCVYTLKRKTRNSVIDKHGIVASSATIYIYLYMYCAVPMCIDTILKTNTRCVNTQIQIRLNV